MVAFTHGPGGGGFPRLVPVEASRKAYSAVEEGRSLAAEYPIPSERMFSIGADASCDLVLPGLLPIQAQIGRDPRDEFVVVDFSDGSTTIAGKRADGLSLHAGDRLGLDHWELVFERAESHDHGRPFGGREGGEGSVQESQPPRRLDLSAPLLADIPPATDDRAEAPPGSSESLQS